MFVIFVGLQTRNTDAQFGGVFGGGPKIEIVETAQLESMLESHQEQVAEAKKAGFAVPPADFVVVDVRSDAEINVSIIPGAITKAEYEKNEKQYAGKLVIPYCTVGGRSGAYAKQLAAKGVTVKNYKGSILEWIGAELPLVTLDGTPTNRVHTYSDRYRIPEKYEQVTK